MAEREFGMLNEQVAGTLRVLSDRSVLNDPDSSAITIGTIGRDNPIVRTIGGLQPHVTDDGNHPNTITMVGLKNDNSAEGEAIKTFEKLGFTLTDKEKTISSLFHFPVDDDRSGDRKFVYTSTVLTTTNYNLDP